MKKQVFIDAYVVAFMAASAAMNHADYCSRGMQKELTSPDLSEPYFLAACAWKKVGEEGPKEQKSAENLAELGAGVPQGRRWGAPTGPGDGA